MLKVARHKNNPFFSFLSHAKAGILSKLALGPVAQTKGRTRILFSVMQRRQRARRLLLLLLLLLPAYPERR